MDNKRLENIRYISLPSSLDISFPGFRIDTAIKVPVLKEGSKDSEITVESLIAGMVTVIAWDDSNPDAPYFRSFVKALDPDIVAKLNQAAIAKEQRKDYIFAEELFLAVYHLLPQYASCINLATLYSYLAAEDRNKGEDGGKWIRKVRETLEDGLSRFGEEEHILSELASFEAFMGYFSDAKEYLDRYFAVAEEGEKKEEMKKLRKEVEFQLENEDAITEAYDFITLGESKRALPVIERFLSAYPRIWNGWFLKGWALRLEERYEEARECFLECIRLGESNSEIYNELSICELECGEKELAKAYLETACDLDEDNLTTTTNLALLYLGDGEFDEAREYLERARYISGDDRMVKALIADYEKATGEKIGAIIHEEYVRAGGEDGEYDAKGFEEGFRALSEEIEASWSDEDDDDSCACKGHHHHEEGGCGCGGHHHHEEGGCGCGGHHGHGGGCCHNGK